MPSITPVKNAWTPILVGIFMAIAIVVCGFLFNVQDKPFWIKEGGVVETLSALGYFVTAATMLFLGGFQFIKRYYYIVLLILIFGMRELDFDKRFTTMGIFKSRFYLSDTVPLYEKVIGLLVIAVLAWITIQLFRHHFRGLFSNLSNSPVNVGVLLTGMLLVFSKTIDGLGRKLAGVGVTISPETDAFFGVVEELVELGIPILLFASFIAYLRKKKQEA